VSYFVITCTEDGIAIQTVKSAAAVGSLLEERPSCEFLQAVPGIDKGYFYHPKGISDDAVLIIKGEVVIPKPTKVVERWEVE
jgi:hypothetical protein